MKLKFSLLLSLLLFLGQNLFAQETAKPNLDKGRRLYLSNCISCHNKDPNLKGAVGPQTVNVPFEVIQSKVMTGKYPDPLPAGFVPRRKTKMMKAIPKLKNDIRDIHAWIESMKKK